MGHPASRLWTVEETDLARALAAQGVTVAEIAALVGRTPAALRAAANRYRFSLRRPGQPIFGAVLGEPRGRASARDRVRAAYRRAVIDGRVDPEAREAALWRHDLVAEGEEPPVCPRCGQRPAAVLQRTTVGPCHECRRALMADAAVTDDRR
ncbi:MAG: hypothetical protein JXE06_02805 [Coriobacteriia bacterium]|nr:hypothetical protein [Coriobacteriia bacterium]